MPRSNPETITKQAYWQDSFGNFVEVPLNERSRVYTSTNSPRWPMKRPPWHSYLVQMVEARYGQMDVTLVSNGRNFTGYTEAIFAVVGGPPDPATGLPYGAACQNRADDKARSFAKASRGNWLLNFVEFRQLEHLATDTVYRMAHAFRAIRHGDFASLARVLNIRSKDVKKIKGRLLGNISNDPFRIPEVILEIQYGWKPLYADVYDLFNQARKQVETDRTHYRVTGRASGHRSAIATQGTGTLGTFNWVTNDSYKAKTVLEFGLASNIRADLASIGLTNPLDLAWEVIPFSFVVDWFYPVGNFLEGLDAFNGLSFVRGTQSAIAKVDSYARNDMSNTAWRGHTDPEWRRQFVYQRNLLSGFPDIHPPRFKNPVSPTHLYNGIALALAQLRR